MSEGIVLFRYDPMASPSRFDLFSDMAVAFPHHLTSPHLTSPHLTSPHPRDAPLASVADFSGQKHRVSPVQGIRLFGFPRLFMRALILRPPATLRRRPAAGQPELEQGLLPSFQMNQLRVAAD